MFSKFPDFRRFSNFPDHFTEFPDFSLTLKKTTNFPDFSLTTGHPAEVEFSTKTIHKICFQTWCKLNKSTYRLFAPKNLVLTTIFLVQKLNKCTYQVFALIYYGDVVNPFCFLCKLPNLHILFWTNILIQYGNHHCALKNAKK